MKITEVHLRDPYILLDNGKYYMYGTRGSSNGMLFHDKEKQLRFVMHAPNVTPLERPVIKYAKVVDGVIKVSDKKD